MDHYIYDNNDIALIIKLMCYMLSFYNNPVFYNIFILSYTNFGKVRIFIIIYGLYEYINYTDYMDYLFNSDSIGSINLV